MRPIDADNILDFIDNAIKTAHGIGLRPAAALCLKKRIEDEPTIDPVVRCKDCENWARDWFTTSGSSDHFCPMMETFTDPDEFCSRAERRTDG